MFSVVLVFSIIGLGRILISDFVVTNLLMYSLSGMILLYLATSFFTPKVILGKIANHKILWTNGHEENNWPYLQYIRIILYHYRAIINVAGQYVAT